MNGGISAAPDAFDLTDFQQRILYVVAAPSADDERSVPGRARYGLAIKRDIEEQFGVEINRGRLYQNLGTLVSEGYLAKQPLDGRTNVYRLTDAGLDTIRRDAQWRLDHLDTAER